MALEVLVLLVGVLGSVFGESHEILVPGFVVLELCIQVVFGGQFASMSPNCDAGGRQASVSGLSSSNLQVSDGGGLWERGGLRL